MVRIYSAKHSIEAQAVKLFLDSKGIESRYDDPIVTGLGPVLIPIFIHESARSETLENEIHTHLQSYENKLTLVDDSE